CIYGLGDPEEYGQSSVNLRVGETYKRDKILRRLTDIYYERNDYDLSAGKFRVRGDTLEVHPSSQGLSCASHSGVTSWSGSPRSTRCPAKSWPTEPVSRFTRRVISTLARSARTSPVSGSTSVIRSSSSPQ